MTHRGWTWLIPAPWLVAAFITIAIVAPACGNAPQEAPLQELTVYRPIGTWTGRGPVQTDAFIGETGAFRLRWRAHTPRTPSGGSFRVFLHSSVSGRPLVTVVEREGAGEGETFVTEDPREFFLVIEASDLEWSITLDEAVRARGPASGTL